MRNKSMVVCLLVALLVISLVFAACQQEEQSLVDKYEHISILEAQTLARVAGEAGTTEEYTIVGTIVEVSNATYGEMTVQDADGDKLYIYGSMSADGTYYDSMTDKPVKGDEVVLKGVLKTFENTPQMGTKDKKAIIVDFVHVKVEVDASEYPACTIAKARDAQTGTKVKLTGVVAAITYANGKIPSGVILVDDTASIYVYDKDIAQQVSVGNKIEVAGSKTYWILDDEQKYAQTHGYIGACQIDEAVLVSNDKKSNDFNKSWVETVTVKELLNTEFSENISSLVVKSTAVIKKAQNPGFVNYYIDDLDGTTGTYVYTQCNGSDFAWLDKFDGKVCEVYYTALNAKSTASGCVWRLIPVAVSEIENFSYPASDVPAFAIEYAVKDLFKSGVFGADPAIKLPNSYVNEIIGADNVTISYSSSNNAVATLTVGQDNTTLNLVGEGTSTITITATFGSHSKTQTVDVTLDPTAEIETPTVAEIIATADGTEVMLRGVVMSSLVNQTGFYISDSTGMIAVRSTGDVVSQLKAGQEVVVKGIKKHHKKNDSATDYVGQIVIDNATVIANYYGEHEYDTSYFITDKTVSDLNKLDVNADYSTNVYVVEALVEVVETSYYTNLKIKDPTTGTDISLYCSGAGQYSWLFDYKGQVVTLEIAPCNWNGKTYYAFCAISATDSEGNKIVNTLNFGE